MTELTADKIRGTLVKHLPAHGSFVQNFMRDDVCGFLHGKKIAGVQKKLLQFGSVDLSGKKSEALQWATMLHDITYLPDRTEYLKVFAGNEVSKESIFPVLSGLSSGCIAKVVKEVNGFSSALKKIHAPLYPFHNLTTALFAYDVLTKENELSGADAVIAAQAIILHHERNIELLPADHAVRLLRDSVKIESLGEKNLADNITGNVREYSRSFFDPLIPIKLRKEILEGRISPSEQESRDPKLNLDAFQFALEFLFPDTNPDMFALPGIVGPYLQRDQLFFDHLRVIFNAIEEHSLSPRPQLENLRSLKVLFQLAMRSGKYAGIIDNMQMGEGAVKAQLERAIKGIEYSMKSCPSEEFPSLSDLLAMKAEALHALEKNQERNVVWAEAILRHRIEDIMSRNSESGN